MKRSFYRDLGIFFVIILVIFYPLFYTHYVYTDEIVQLRNFRKGSGFRMFAEQGRFITNSLFQYLFSGIDTIQQITRLRLFSLLGWMVCIPVWYTILIRVCRKEELPGLLPFITVIYLMACPPFCVYVSWASCMELFIANTSGLLAGYVLYSKIKYLSVPGKEEKRMELPLWAIAWTFLLGVISLSTYQNGFGCFLLPFLLHLVAKKEWSRTIAIAIGMYFLTFLLYYAMFRLQLHLWHMGPTERTGLFPEPLSKLLYFLARPLETAFHFTWIVNERSRTGNLIYAIIFGGWFLLSLFILRSRTLSFRLRYGVGIFAFLGLIYLPSLIVKENYSSNRTLLALDMAVFLLVFATLLQMVRTEKYRLIMAGLLGIFFVANAWYNFRYQFLKPVKKEYDLVRNYIDTQYHPGIINVTFIRPSEELFQRKYGINTSWDEFGVPSNFRKWVPTEFVRQVVFETTGNRAAADSLVIANWDKQAYEKGGQAPSPHTLTIDVEHIMQ